MELFDPAIVSKDSPRLAWIKKHNIHTYKSPGIDTEDEPWNCWSGPFEQAIPKDNNYSTGQTEEDAIANWAIKAGVRLWNEQ